jgi:hypothetical protein
LNDAKFALRRCFVRHQAIIALCDRAEGGRTLELIEYIMAFLAHSRRYAMKRTWRLRRCGHLLTRYIKRRTAYFLCGRSLLPSGISSLRSIEHRRRAVTIL